MVGAVVVASASVVVASAVEVLVLVHMVTHIVVDRIAFSTPSTGKTISNQPTFQMLGSIVACRFVEPHPLGSSCSSGCSRLT